MSSRCALAITLALLAFSTVEAEAEIVLSIDTTAETFSFSGSDTGTPGFDGFAELITWEIIHPTIPGSVPDITSFGPFSPDPHWGSSALTITNDPDFETLLTVGLYSDTGPFGSITVTPNTTVYDYSFLSPELMTILTEAINVGSIPLGFFDTSSGFSSITVTSVSGPSGDFDMDGDTDGNDFLEWQRTDGTSGSLTAWQTDYGTPISTLATSITVPEPSSLWLSSMVGIAVCNRRRRSS